MSGSTYPSNWIAFGAPPIVSWVAQTDPELGTLKLVVEGNNVAEGIHCSYDMAESVVTRLRNASVRVRDIRINDTGNDGVIGVGRHKVKRGVACWSRQPHGERAIESVVAKRGDVSCGVRPRGH